MRIDPTGLFDWDLLEVEDGDTLSEIVVDMNEKADTDYTTQEIADFNGIDDPDLITTGEWIAVPDDVFDAIYPDKIITSEENNELNDSFQDGYNELYDNLYEKTEDFNNKAQDIVGTIEMIDGLGISALGLFLGSKIPGAQVPAYGLFMTGIFTIADGAYHIFGLETGGKTIIDDLILPPGFPNIW